MYPSLGTDDTLVLRKNCGHQLTRETLPRRRTSAGRANMKAMVEIGHQDV